MLRTLGGTALLLGAILSLTRMIPVMANLPDGFGTFPPETAEQIALLHSGNTIGVVISHIMALLAFLCYGVGFSVLFKLLWGWTKPHLALPFIVASGFGLALFSMAVVIDGFILHLVTDYFTAATSNDPDMAGFLVVFVHKAALSFMAPGQFGLMVGLACLTYGLLRSRHYNRWLNGVGLAIGVLAIVAYTTGIAGPYWNNMQLAGLLILLSHVWYLWLGVAVLRHR